MSPAMDAVAAAYAVMLAARAAVSDPQLRAELQAAADNLRRVVPVIAVPPVDLARIAQNGGAAHA